MALVFRLVTESAINFVGVLQILEFGVVTGFKPESLVGPVEYSVVITRCEELDDAFAHVAAVEIFARAHALADHVRLGDVGDHLGDSKQAEAHDFSRGSERQSGGG